MSLWGAVLSRLFVYFTCHIFTNSFFSAACVGDANLTLSLALCEVLFLERGIDLSFAIYPSLATFARGLRLLSCVPPQFDPFWKILLCKARESRVAVARKWR
jgi:hypothetical protein